MVLPDIAAGDALGKPDCWRSRAAISYHASFCRRPRRGLLRALLEGSQKLPGRAAMLGLSKDFVSIVGEH